MKPKHNKFSLAERLLKSVLVIALGAITSISSVSCNSKKKAEQETESAVADMIMGGDISELTYIEDNGGKYYDAEGNPQECLKILSDNGMNLVRLRLYNDPGNPDYTPSNRLPKGYQNPEDILCLAKRAKDAGMMIELTFHYSDYWAAGECQNKPHEWSELQGDSLKQTLYEFTKGFMEKMAAQGTTPEYVSIGNESQGGILFPDGNYENFDYLADLYKEGIRGVKEVSPESQTIIHLDDGGNYDKYNWYFDELEKRGVPYEIIGASYYPFWTKKDVPTIMEWAKATKERFSKPILIMETGYAWAEFLPSGKHGQLADNGPYKEFSPKAQKEFLSELIDGIRNSDGAVIGFIYWDPIFIEVPGLGWELGGDNVVSNTTLFDFQGRLLPVMEAFKE